MFGFSAVGGEAITSVSFTKSMGHIVPSSTGQIPAVFGLEEHERYLTDVKQDCRDIV